MLPVSFSISPELPEYFNLSLPATVEIRDSCQSRLIKVLPACDTEMMRFMSEQASQRMHAARSRFYRN